MIDAGEIAQVDHWGVLPYIALAIFTYYQLSFTDVEQGIPSQ
jgi:hypothetical protein